MSESGQERWVRFRLGVAFPADSTLARWVAWLSLVADDLTHANVVLARELASSSSRPSPEGVFYFWLACAQFREAAKLLQDGYECPQVREFIVQLPVDARQRWEQVRASFEPWDGSFVKRVMKPIRDGLFHYPLASGQEARRILDGLAPLDTGVRHGAQEQIADIRCVFADELRTALLSSHLGGDLQEIGQEVAQVADLMTALIGFARDVLGAYLVMLPDGALRLDR